MSEIRNRGYTNLISERGDGEKESRNDTNQTELIRNNFKTQSLKKSDNNQTLKEVNDINGKFNSKTEPVGEKMKLNKVYSSVDDEKRTNNRKNKKLSEKEYTCCQSLLTELFEISHIQTVRNMFRVSLILIILSTAIKEWTETGSVDLGLKLFQINFGKFHNVICIWLCMKLSTLVVFCFVRLWTIQYRKYSQKPHVTRMLNMVYSVGFFIYILLSIYLPLKALLDLDLPICSSIIILMEKFRIFMKVYSFVRTNVSSVLSNNRLPELSKFIYFLFAPTLIYRDHYPRNSTIRWSFVFGCFTEIILTIVFLAYLFEHVVLPTFENFGIEPFNFKKLVLKIFAVMLPGSLIYFSGFYLLLHCWMNAWAEMLRFGDRKFYKDWWNTTSFDSFYRTWNIAVHDWLYTYVYKDAYEYLGCRKLTSQLITFLLSAIVHEYILSYSFRFFCPILFILFIGNFVIAVISKIMPTWPPSNLLFWFCMATGNGIIISLYAIEGFARLNCQPYSNDFWDYIIPRSLTTCY